MRLYSMLLMALLFFTASVKSEDIVGQAVEQYSAAVNAENKEHATKLKDIKDALLSTLNKEVKAAAGRGDLAAAQRAEEEIKKLADSADGKSTPPFKAGASETKNISQPTTPAPVATSAFGQYQPGLFLSEYPRQKSQDGESGGYVPSKMLGEPFAEPTIITSVHSFKYNTSRNAKAEGFLKIEQPGEYAFKIENWKNRCALIVNGVEMRKSYGSDWPGVTRVQLPAGMIPITCLGYVATSESTTVSWQPPGAKELSPIPDDRLFHLPLPAKK